MKHVRVGDVLNLARRSVDIDPVESYSLIGVYSFGRGIFHREPQLGADLGDYRFFAIEPGDLVLSNIQAWEGAIAHATERDRGRIGTHRFLTYIPADHSVDTNYLHYYFLSEAGHALIRQAAPGSVTRNRTLAIDRFEDLKIPLPDLEEQRIIVARLEALLNRAQVIDRQLKLSDPTRIVALYPGLIEHALASEKPQWSLVKDVLDFVNDIVRPGEPPEPAEAFVGLQHVEPHTGRRIGSIPLGTEKGRKFRFQPGDIVFGYLRPYLNKVWVADIHGLCSVDQYVLRPKTELPAAYLAHALRSRSTLEQAIEMTHNLQLPRLRSGLLASIEIPIVPVTRASEVTERLDRGLARVIEARSLRERQVALVDGLMTSALNNAFAGLR